MLVGKEKLLSGYIGNERLLSVNIDGKEVWSSNITKIEIEVSGTPAQMTLGFSEASNYTRPSLINWGDGYSTSIITGEDYYYHSYENTGVFTISFFEGLEMDYVRYNSPPQISIKKVKFGNGFLSIGALCFSGTNIEEVVFSDSIINIREDAFKDCLNITDISIPSGASAIVIGERAFSGCRNLECVDVGTKAIIQREAFYHCEKLESVSLTEMGVNSSLGESAFEGCIALLEIVIPSGIITISNSAFKNCTNLTSVTIPTVVGIGDEVFYRCTSLTSIIYEGSELAWRATSRGHNWAYSVPSNCKIYCNDGSILDINDWYA